ncbi:MAG TPA: NADH-quinone oxidoreductase subunit F, partial [Kofleriaceae bacterium]
MPTEIGTRLVTARFGNNDARTLAGYEKTGGYAQLRKALSMRPEDITNEVKASNLRGRGGAGFATGVKWGFVPKDAK